MARKKVLWFTVLLIVSIEICDSQSQGQNVDRSPYVNPLQADEPLEGSGQDDNVTNETDADSAINTDSTIETGTDTTDTTLDSTDTTETTETTEATEATETTETTEATETIETTESTETTETTDGTTQSVPEIPPRIPINGQGDVNGIVLNNLYSLPIYAYLKIPYAQPPIGDLRFQNPQPAESLGVRDDPSVDAPRCVQYLEDDIVGQEDCLYLNVYVPEFDPDNVTAKAVMVFLHGNTFDQGSGRLDEFDPRFLLTQDVILVTLNFRLGIFGFFNLDNATLGTTGNAGLKDQRLALQWIKNHISGFGGDPDNISIFGQSGGAVSVHLHLLSPQSAGLFEKAIIQSGTALSAWALGTVNNGINLAEALEIPTENQEAMLFELRSIEEVQLLIAARNISNTLRETDNVWTPFTGPVIEPASENDEDDENAFLTQDPFDLIEAGQYNDVPLLIGFTDAEGIGVKQMLRVQYDWQGIVEDFFNVIPNELELERGSSAAVTLAQRIEQFYFNGNQPEEGNATSLIQLFTDVFFGFPAFRTALEHYRTSNESIYFYKFSADTELNVFKLRDLISADFPGASHGDDLGYLFYIEGKTPILGPEEEAVLQKVVQTWTTFAKTGAPVAQNQETAIALEAIVPWLPFTAEEPHFANIGNQEITPSVNPNDDSMIFWGEIYDEFFRNEAPSLFKIPALLMLSIAAIHVIFNQY